MSSDNTGQPENNPFRRAGFLIAAAFLALVVVLGAVVALGPDPESRASTPPSPPASGQAPQSTGSGGACGLTDTDQSVPTSAPADVTWSVFKTVAVPTSRSAGPGIVEGDVARCYAHTPRGALVATVQIATRQLLADNWREVVERQVIPGPGRDAHVKRRARDDGGPVQPGTYGQLAGFKFVAYTPDIATVQLVTRFPSGRLQVTTCTVTWADGDWRLALQPDGALTPSVQPITALTGFVIWGGV